MVQTITMRAIHILFYTAITTTFLAVSRTPGVQEYLPSYAMNFLAMAQVDTVSCCSNL